MTTLYGIKNCDTVRAARKWLEAQGVDHNFHDFREDGIDIALVEQFLALQPWDKVLNKRSTTWKQLDESERENVSAENIAPLLVEHPTLIKRPVLITGSDCHIGFKAADYSELFREHTL